MTKTETWSYISSVDHKTVSVTALTEAGELKTAEKGVGNEIAQYKKGAQQEEYALKSEVEDSLRKGEWGSEPWKTDPDAPVIHGQENASANIDWKEKSDPIPPWVTDLLKDRELGKIKSFDPNDGIVICKKGVAKIDIVNKELDYAILLDTEKLGNVEYLDSKTGVVTCQKGVAKIDIVNKELDYAISLDTEKLGNFEYFDSENGSVMCQKGVAKIDIVNKELDYAISLDTEKLGNVEYFGSKNGSVRCKKGVAKIDIVNEILDYAIPLDTEKLGNVEYFDSEDGSVMCKKGVAKIDIVNKKLDYAIPLDTEKLGSLEYFDSENGSVMCKKGVAKTDIVNEILDYESSTDIIAEAQNKTVIQGFGRLSYANYSGAVRIENDEGEITIGMLDLSVPFDPQNPTWKVEPETTQGMLHKPMGHGFGTKEYMDEAIDNRIVFDELKIEDLTKEQIKWLQEKPIALLLHGAKDNGQGAAWAANNNHRLIDQYRVLQFGEIKTEGDLYTILDKFKILKERYGININVCEILGHGSDKHLVLGDDDSPHNDLVDQEKRILDSSDKKELSKYTDVFKNTIMLINSCSNGEGGKENFYSIANDLYGTVFKDAQNIYTMGYSGNCDWVFDDSWKVNGVKNVRISAKNKGKIYDVKNPD